MCLIVVLSNYGKTSLSDNDGEVINGRHYFKNTISYINFSTANVIFLLEEMMFILEKKDVEDIVIILVRG